MDARGERRQHVLAARRARNHGGLDRRMDLAHRLLAEGVLDARHVEVEQRERDVRLLAETFEGLVERGGLDDPFEAEAAFQERRQGRPGKLVVIRDHGDAWNTLQAALRHAAMRPDRTADIALRAFLSRTKSERL